MAINSTSSPQGFFKQVTLQAQLFTMADPFASQLSAFKKSLKGAAELPPQKRSVEKADSGSSSTVSTTTSKKPKIEKPLYDDDFDEDDKPINGSGKSQLSAAAQMAREHQQNGTLTMKLMSSSDYIKSKDREVPIFELESSLGFKVDPQLLKCLTNVDRIKYNPETQSFQYLSLHNIKTAEDLLNVLKNQPAFAGLSVKQLKDGWNNCLPTIEQLEKENKIIVHKTKKDNSPRHIWLNVDQLPIKVYNGVQNFHSWEILTGQAPAINKEDDPNKNKTLDMIFYEMWNVIPIPNHDELVKMLVDNGLKPTNAEPESMKSKKITSVQERKQKKSRRGKITNIHMKGILKDYSSQLK